MIPERHHVKLGKFLSLVLRHRPERIGIQLDGNGWTDVNTLLQKMNDFGKVIDLETLEFIVENNNKKRYAFNAEKDKIRANQGHSLQVDLGYQVQPPPDILYHGTASRFVDSILKTGLQKRNRHHVHLSKDLDTALNVGQRHGKPVIFEVLSKEMHQDGFDFFVSTNAVWLTDEVPTKYLRRKGKE